MAAPRVHCSVQQVRNILASLLHRDPDQRMSVRELRDFALAGQLWEPDTPQEPQKQHGKRPLLPISIVRDLVDLKAKLAATSGQCPEWIAQCTGEDGDTYWQRLDHDDEDDENEDGGSDATGSVGEASDDGPPPLVDSDDDDGSDIAGTGSELSDDGPPPLVDSDNESTVSTLGDNDDDADEQDDISSTRATGSTLSEMSDEVAPAMVVDDSDDEFHDCTSGDGDEDEADEDDSGSTTTDSTGDMPDDGLPPLVGGFDDE